MAAGRRDFHRASRAQLTAHIFKIFGVLRVHIERICMRDLAARPDARRAAAEHDIDGLL
jgi:hypothetical protein